MRKSIPVPFLIFINLVHLTQSNAFCKSVKHAHNSSSIFKVILVVSSTTQLHPYYLLLSSIQTDLLQVRTLYPFQFSSKYSRYYLCCKCDEADFATVATSCSFGCFFKGIIVTSAISFGHSPISYILLTS